MNTVGKKSTGARHLRLVKPNEPFYEDGRRKPWTPTPAPLLWRNVARLHKDGMTEFAISKELNIPYSTVMAILDKPASRFR